MRRNLEIAFLASIFLGSALATWTWSDLRWKRINTPEVIAQRKIDAGIQKDLCERIKRDIASFTESPAAFRRVPLKTLESESKASLRFLLISEGVPTDFPVEFRGRGSRFVTCVDDAGKWLQLPSTDSQQLLAEYEATGLKPPKGLTEYSTASSTTQASPGRNTRRLALVVGNANYQNRPLLNPLNDAEDIASTLTEKGFEVIHLRDANTSVLKRGIEQYMQRLRDNDVGIVYFAGHGVEHAGRNYILPVDFNASDEDEIPRLAVDVTVLVDKVSKANGKVNIVILDACRSSFITSRGRSNAQGLSPMPPVSGTIIAFATAPGSIAMDGSGRNSPYTKNLLRVLKEPGNRIEDVFKKTASLVEIETGGRQNPWYSSSLKSDFSLN